MRQEYSNHVHEYHTSYDVARANANARLGNHHAQSLVAENARVQEMKEQQTSELAPGAYMMSKIVENNGSRYRTGRGEDGRYMTTDDYANLYRSRRVCHVNENETVIGMGSSTTETEYSRVSRPAYAQNNTQREQPVRSVRESGYASRPATAAYSAQPRNEERRVASRPTTANVQRAHEGRKAPSAAPMPSVRKAPTATVVRRQPEAPVAQWLPSGERYIRVRNQRRFPIAMVMMIIAVSVSLLLIVCGSVMTSHMEREVCALNNELAELNEIAQELEGELALKNDPLKMERLATELGMVRGEYVQTRVLQNPAEEYTVVYSEDETPTLSLTTLLSAIGFFKD